VEGYYARTILLVCVLACLCFSAGEGLRLMPLAPPVSDGAARPNLGVVSGSPGVSSQYQYATCGLEKRGQKLTHRQQARGGLLTSRNGGEPPAVGEHPAAEIESASYPSQLFASRSLGRAPPSA
jgi:hypothetical protein